MLHCNRKCMNILLEKLSGVTCATKIESSILCEKNNIVQYIRELRGKTETQTEKIRSPKQLGFITKQNLKKWRLTQPDVPDRIEIKEGHNGLFPFKLTPLCVHTNGSAR